MDEDWDANNKEESTLDRRGGQAAATAAADDDDEEEEEEEEESSDKAALRQAKEALSGAPKMSSGGYGGIGMSSPSASSSSSSPSLGSGVIEEASSTFSFSPFNSLFTSASAVDGVGGSSSRRPSLASSQSKLRADVMSCHVMSCHVMCD